MAEIVLEEMFFWAVTGVLAFVSIFLWGVYLIGPADWGPAWPAIPATAAMVVTGVVAMVMHRNAARRRPAP